MIHANDLFLVLLYFAPSVLYFSHRSVMMHITSNQFCLSNFHWHRTQQLNLWYFVFFFLFVLSFSMFGTLFDIPHIQQFQYNTCTINRFHLSLCAVLCVCLFLFQIQIRFGWKKKICSILTPIHSGRSVPFFQLLIYARKIENIVENNFSFARLIGRWNHSILFKFFFSTWKHSKTDDEHWQQTIIMK